MWGFGSERRHGRQRSSRASFSSKISLTSTSTSTAPVSSSASSSTVRAESTTRRRSRTTPSKPSLITSKRRATSGSSFEAQDHGRSSASKEPSNEENPVNVFQYLDTWPSRAASKLSLVETPAELPAPVESDETSASRQEESADDTEEERSVASRDETSDDTEEQTSDDEQSEDDASGELTPPPTHIKDEAAAKDITESFHSDSGIVLRDDTPNHSPADSGPESVASEAMLEEPPRWRGPKPTGSPLTRPRPLSSISIEDAESFYRSATWMSQSHDPWIEHTSHPRTASPARTMDSFQDLHGRHYSLDSSRLSAPLYRKFERLNFRILDALQEEISQLELMLNQLDAGHASFPSDGRALPSPTYAPSSPIHNPINHLHRQDLVNQIQAKLEQYNRALSSFQQVNQSFPTSSEQEDFIAISRPSSRIGFGEHGTLAQTPTSSAILTTCILSVLAVIFPLLVFSFIPSFFGRLALLIILIAAGFFGSRNPKAREFITDHEANVCLIGYLAIMIGAALLVS